MSPLNKEFEEYLYREIQDSTINYRESINNEESDSVISTFYGEMVAFKQILHKFKKMNRNTMSLKENFERISYIANVCRTQNTNSEIQSMLNEIDSTIADMICKLYGIDEYEKMGNDNE